MKVILLGPPGAGKGTQAARVADELGVTRAASGDLFRENLRNETELGLLAKSYMDKGELVPDDVTIRLVMSWINAPEQDGGFVLDGFPRTLPQAEALDSALEPSGGLDRVLYVNVAADELVRRLAGRFICPICQTPYHLLASPPKIEGRCDFEGGVLYQRDDDKPEVVKNRLRVYFDETEPLVGHYRGSGVLREIDGKGTIDAVGDQLVDALR
ncbi:MAG: adenylate kinase [Chloroflexota bacterium]|nr:adenylate kinase [Chloroflexota bacterium]